MSNEANKPLIVFANFLHLFDGRAFEPVLGALWWMKKRHPPYTPTNSARAGRRVDDASPVHHFVLAGNTAGG
ncbi:hypothetical protein [Pseudomonas sp. zfem005]|uniref:hypothetical protein n=1 Tax=Pseudomonas sp. zfem005 TaxID=3078200 RepID=UPI002929C5CC|nr:hypothetical protein [Pseudomonas sp. zfem005]MDU9414857.1 hypothetical protein [Pseudomonas sp. zfem005]